jgi:pyroglutamyl-peptidase
LILFSAFEPFDVDPENSSELALRGLLARKPEGVRGVVLPVSFARAWPALKAEILTVRPAAIVALGQADSRNQISFEEVAVNRIQARLKDVDGHQPMDDRVEVGPDETASLLPNGELVRVLTGAGIDAGLSQSAGRYVCNALMYSLVKWAASNGVKAGFVHLPLLVGQVTGSGREAFRPAHPVLTLDKAIRSLELITEYLCLA